MTSLTTKPTGDWVDAFRKHLPTRSPEMQRLRETSVERSLREKALSWAATTSIISTAPITGARVSRAGRPTRGRKHFTMTLYRDGGGYSFEIKRLGAKPSISEGKLVMFDGQADAMQEKLARLRALDLGDLYSLNVQCRIEHRRGAVNIRMEYGLWYAVDPEEFSRLIGGISTALLVDGAEE